MRIGVIILGIIAGSLLFISGCSGAFFFGVGGDILGEDTSSLVAAGFVAMIGSPIILLGGALPYALRKTCFGLLVVGTIFAWFSFVIDLQSLFALFYLFGSLMTTVALILAGLALRRRRDDPQR